MNKRILGLIILSITLMLGAIFQMTVEAASTVWGDCDQNGVLESADSIAIYTRIEGGSYQTRCDLNLDAKISSADLVCLEHVLATGVGSCLPLNANAPLGTNLYPVADWSNEYVFVDAFKSSSGWIPRKDWSTLVQTETNKLNLDEYGWILSLPAADDTTVNYRWVSTLLFNDMKGSYPAGRYIVTYDGEGELLYGMDAKIDAAQSRPDEGYQEFVVITPTRGIEIHLYKTNPENYIRNIRIYMPDTNHDSIVHSDFINSVKDYKVLRFMDWARTNWLPSATARSAESLTREEQIELQRAEGTVRRLTDPNDPITWAGRPLPTDARYSTDKGVPIEVMVDVANQVNADTWFNIPHAATDDYVEGMAQLVLDELGATQQVYIEYTNEMWNVSFGQQGWIQTQADAAMGSMGSAEARRMNWYGQRTNDICGIWKRVWGSQSDRLKCVVGMQAGTGGYTWLGQQILDCPLLTGDCNDYIDGVAIAPYFGGRLASGSYTSIISKWTLDDLFTQLSVGGVLSGTTSSEVDDAINNMTKYAAWTESRGLELVAYEMGQHLHSGNTAINNFFVDANRDARMSDVYDQYLAGWQSSGAKMGLHLYNIGRFGQYGSWGLAETYNDTTSPKLLALQKFMGLNPCWWQRCGEQVRGIDSGAKIKIESQEFVTNQTVTVPIFLETGQNDVGGISFTIYYEPGQIAFNSRDVDGDGIPDGLQLRYDSADFATIVTQASGEIHLTIYSKKGYTSLPEGILLNVIAPIQPSGGAGIWLGNGTASIARSVSLDCSDEFGRAILCVASGTLFNYPPTAVKVQQIESAERSTIPLLFLLLISLTTVTTRAYYPIFKQLLKR